MEISIFADERKNIANRWHYICLLIIPTPKIDEVINIIQNKRDAVGYQNEIKFGNLPKKGKGERVALGSELLKEIISDGKTNGGKFYFKILGIDKKNLQFNRFGDDDGEKGKYATIYNRFFRMTLLGSINYFFRSRTDNLTISYLVHDSEGNLENHEYFDWHSIWKLDSEYENISFANDEIIFVNSDHHEETSHPRFSHLVQLTDLILGAVSFCIEYSNPGNKGQKQCANVMLPLVDRIISAPKNQNSSFGYYRKYDIDFFPSTTKLGISGEVLQGQIYKNREVVLKTRNSKQISFFEKLKELTKPTT